MKQDLTFIHREVGRVGFFLFRHKNDFLEAIVTFIFLRGMTITLPKNVHNII